MGDGWRLDFSQTHFDAFSPPDFYTKVSTSQIGKDHRRNGSRSSLRPYLVLLMFKFGSPSTKHAKRVFKYLIYRNSPYELGLISSKQS
jgi:hypothetical protein